METLCKACGAPAPHEPRYDDGIALGIAGNYVQRMHSRNGYAYDADKNACEWKEATCSGFIFALETGVGPCNVCRKGQRAVWYANLLRGDWPHNPAARRVFYDAEQRWPDWLDAKGRPRTGAMNPEELRYEAGSSSPVAAEDPRVESQARISFDATYPDA